MRDRIINRWLYNSLGVIVGILLLVELAFGVSIRLFYYNSVSQTLTSQLGVVSSLLTSYAESGTTDFGVQVRSYIENFEYKDTMELMALDSEGNVLITSSGFPVEGTMILPDFTNALTAQDGTGQYQGDFRSENVMAVSSIAPINSEGITVVRLIVSLDNVDELIFAIIAASLIVVFVIVFFAAISGFYFINSIVRPLGEIGSSARRIASGNFDARVESKHNDEIGELCETINQMAIELSRSDKMKNDFISSVSHELRTPLTAIKGWGETILSDTHFENNSHAKEQHTNQDTLKKGMGVIMKETDRLSLMVEELLDFSRMQSGRFKLSIAKADMLAELGEVVLMYTEKAKREQIPIIYDEPMFDAFVFADTNRLRQVFINVIDNAIKYSDAGGQVDITATKDNDYFIIAVADRGCGISPEDLPNIKQKFYKANLTRRGSGIGLAVADEIMRLHHGALELESELGKGTTVIIKIPNASFYQSQIEDDKKQGR